MDDTEWIFELLYELSGASDAAGMRRLSHLLNICMDVYIAEERLVMDACTMFRSGRAVAARNSRKVWPFDRTLNTPGRHTYRPVPPHWLNMLETQIEATRVSSDRIKRCQVLPKVSKVG